MPRARHEIAVRVPRSVAWRYLTDVASMPDWAFGVRRVEFTTDQKQGVGTQWRQVDTWGPARLTHLMEITSSRAEEEQTFESVTRPRLELRQRLTPIDDHSTRVEWTLELEFPFGPLGAMAERAGGEWLTSNYVRRTSESFKRYVEIREGARRTPARPEPGAEEVGGSHPPSVITETARLETTGDKLGRMPPVEPPERPGERKGASDTGVDEPPVAP